MRFRTIVPVLVAVGAFALTGCSTVESPAGASRPRHSRSIHHTTHRGESS